MTTVLCTLYNSLYLDKGLVLYDSLCNCTKDFKLYVLCMDDKCYEVLFELNQPNHIPIKLSDFEKGDDALLEAKSNRPIGEYCWTCSSSFIRYIIRELGENICTYIDADMYFYNNPQVLIEEMLDAEKSVMVVPHRFPDEKKDEAKIVGTYCVEFNTFVNNKESLEVLEYWRKRCLDCCTNLKDGIHWGDQKYLDEIVDKFSCVHVCQNDGAGVAPWNLKHYKSSSTSGYIVWGKSRKKIPLIFFHFQYIKYITREQINTNIKTKRGIDLKLVDSLYYPYLYKLEEKKQFLEHKYGIDSLIKHHPLDKMSLRRRNVIDFFNPKRIIHVLKSQFLRVQPYIVDISQYDKNNNI